MLHFEYFLLTLQLKIINMEPKISVTEETRAVVEHYLQKQWARRAKRMANKKPATDSYDPLKGKKHPKA
jgi:hypothetical protein